MPDNHGGVRAGVEHLIAHGHTRIGFVGSRSQYDYRERYAAYREVMADHGLSAGEDLYFPATNYAESGGADAGRAVVAAAERPTALMVATDQNALGVIQELTAAGLSVPDDIAVMGFDNVEQGIFSTPTLSSVCQRFDAVGALAGRLVMACIRGDEVRPGNYTAEAVVVFPRGSCGCRNDPFGDQGKPSERSTGIAVAPEELGRMLHTLFDGRDSGALDADAVGVITSEVERLLLEPEEVTPDRLRRLVRTLRQLAPREQTLQGLATALTEYVERLVRAGSFSDASAAIRLAAMLWQMQTYGAVQQSHRLESSVLEDSDVAAALLRADASAARGLLWMADTHVRAGVLALWQGPPSEGRLRIAGVYDSTGLLDDTLGEEADIRHFPPRDMLGLARTSEGEVCMVLPVRTGERDWGVLAVLGVINTTSTREAYHSWTSLLCAAFEGEELEEAVRASEERLAYAARASNDGQWELDLSTRSLYLSARCSDLLNLPPDVEPDVETWTAAVHPEDREAVRATMAEAAARGDVPVQVEYRVLTADGSFRWVLSRSLGVGTADGSVVRLIGSLSDIHPRKELEEQLRQAALYDTVTGLPNRRLFLDRLTWAVEQSQRRSGARFAVVFLDLDGFKLINDSLGHLMGDELLRTVGARLGSDLRSVDTAARFGGDEFAVLLFDLKHEAVLSIVERIQERIAAPVVLDGHEVSVTASVGVATSETGYTEAEDVLRDADIAMYQAKDAERGTASVFDPAMHTRATERLQVQSELRTALIEEQFVVHYQPVVSLDGSALTQFEALVRWEHPERGILLPGDFLPVMAETGTIVTLGQWIVDSVCAQVAAWRTDYDGPVAVSVNLSHREFWSVVRAAAAHGDPVPVAAPRAAAVPHPGDHRVGDHGRPRGCPAGHGRPVRERCAPVHQRLRHRPVLAARPACVPGRRPQDRPVLRPADRRGRPDDRAGADHRDHGVHLRHRRRRGGRGDRRSGRPAAHHGMRHRPGLALRQGPARDRGRGDARRAPGGADRGSHAGGLSPRAHPCRRSRSTERTYGVTHLEQSGRRSITPRDPDRPDDSPWATRLPHVTTDARPRSHCPVAVLRDHDDVPEGASNRSCDARVELVGHDAAHVVGLDQ